MRDVKYTTRFQRDYKREKSGRHGKKLDALLMEVVNLLVADKPLPRRNFDHSLYRRMERSPRLPHSARSHPHLPANRTRPVSNLSDSAPTANSASESPEASIPPLPDGDRSKPILAISSRSPSAKSHRPRISAVHLAHPYSFPSGLMVY